MANEKPRVRWQDLSGEERYRVIELMLLGLGLLQAKDVRLLGGDELGDHAGELLAGVFLQEVARMVELPVRLVPAARNVISIS